MLFFEVEVRSVRKNNAYHESASFDSARCVMKCCCEELYRSTLADAESLYLGCVIFKIVRDVCSLTEEQDAVCSCDVDL